MRPPALAACLATLALVPAAAHAEPITAVYAASAGFSADPSTFSATGSSIDLGTITLDAASDAYIYVDGLAAHRNYALTFDAVDPAGASWTSLTAEILDPLSDGHDALDPSPQPSYVPADYSTSNNTDGLSFAWNSGLARSATFASGGAASLFVNEDTNSHDLLQFDGFSGGDSALVTFGLRDNSGGRGFLVRLSVNGDPPAGSQTPEPASLLLLGTGIAGFAGARRKFAAR